MIEIDEERFVKEGDLRGLRDVAFDFFNLMAVREQLYAQMMGWTE